jgi:hypothetical protein
MNRNKNILIGVAMAVVLVGVTSGAMLPPRQKVMAKRAAELDAYRLMAERILGLKISSDSAVRDFVLESDDIKTSLDHFIKGMRIDDDKTVWYEDGSCEVTAEVTLAKTITELKKICEQHYKGNKYTKETFNHIKKYTQRNVISVVGSAAVRETSQIPEPETIPVVMPLVSPRDRKRLDLPPIYGKFTARNRLNARRVAQVDAYRKLAERIYGLRVTGTTTVTDYVADDRIRTAMDHELKGAKINSVRYQPDGIVEMQISLTLKQVISTLKKIYEEHREGNKVTKETFENIEKQEKRKTVTVIGMGAVATPGESETGRGETYIRTETTKIIEGPVAIEIY